MGSSVASRAGRALTLGSLGSGADASGADGDESPQPLASQHNLRTPADAERAMQNRGVVLFDVNTSPSTDGNNQHDTHHDAHDHHMEDDEDVITPTESIGVPTHYHANDDFYGVAQLRKLDDDYRRHSKTGMGTPDRFLRQPGAVDAVYPDQDEHRCPILYEPTAQILIGAFLGVLLGALLSSLGVSKDVSALVNLPGTIFLQILKCFVLPMIFTSLTTGVADLVLMGKVSVIGTQTSAYFIGLSLVASILSTVVSLLLRGLHPDVTHSAIENDTAFLEVQCSDGMYWAMNTTTSAIICAGVTNTNATTLEMVDLTGVVLADATASAASGVTSQITDILHELLPSNIFQSFQDGTLLSVITFSVVFGAAAVKVSSREHSPLLAVLTQMNLVFFQIIRKLIDWSPLFVLSLVAGSLSSQSMLAEAITHVGIMMLGYFISVIIFEFIFLPTVMWVALKKNPFPYMRAMVPAALFAFGCSSSLVTLPVTLRCVESTREVSRSLLHFVLTIGCTAHKNGSAIYFPSAMVFLVSTAEQELDMGAVEIALIILISLLGSIGAAPITNSSLVVIYSIWQTVYPNVPMPASFSYLVAIAWFVGRFTTVCNIVGDTYVARIIAEQVDETYEANHINQNQNQLAAAL
jgi:solute carrier family 1 (neutral amino acid transporter) protein 5